MVQAFKDGESIEFAGKAVVALMQGKKYTTHIYTYMYMYKYRV